VFGSPLHCRELRHDVSVRGLVVVPRGMVGGLLRKKVGSMCGRATVARPT